MVGHTGVHARRDHGGRDGGRAASGASSDGRTGGRRGARHRRPRQLRDDDRPRHRRAAYRAHDQSRSRSSPSARASAPLRAGGALCDVAPTVLGLLGLEPPGRDDRPRPPSPESCMRLVTPAVLLSRYPRLPPSPRSGTSRPSRPTATSSTTTTSRRYASYFDGSGGTLGIGPHDGWMYGLRFQMRGNRFDLVRRRREYGPLSGTSSTPSKPVGERILGPVDQTVWIPEACCNATSPATRTGTASRRSAGIGVGAGFGSDTAAGHGGYEFGTKFFFTPYAGLARPVAHSWPSAGEARVPLCKLSYPGVSTLDHGVRAESSAPAASGSRRAGSSVGACPSTSDTPEQPHPVRALLRAAPPAPRGLERRPEPGDASVRSAIPPGTATTTPAP